MIGPLSLVRRGEGWGEGQPRRATLLYKGARAFGPAPLPRPLPCVHGRGSAVFDALRLPVAAGGGALREAIDQWAEGDAAVGGGFGEEALGGEAGERVDLEQVGAVRLLVDHDVDACEVA